MSRSPEHVQARVASGGLQNSRSTFLDVTSECDAQSCGQLEDRHIRTIPPHGKVVSAPFRFLRRVASCGTQTQAKNTKHDDMTERFGYHPRSTQVGCGCGQVPTRTVVASVTEGVEGMNAASAEERSTSERQGG